MTAQEFDVVVVGSGGAGMVAALVAAQDANDALGAHLELKRAFTTDVSPLLAVARQAVGGAIDPLGVYRASGYRAAKTRERPASGVATAGIV